VSGSPPGSHTELLVVCTGNAARSVMAGFMLERRAVEAGVSLRLTTAGTHAIEGMPISWRTSEAIAQVEAMREVPGIRAHRSRQVVREHLECADLVIGMEGDHVRWVRRSFPEASATTATLKRLCRDLPPGPRPLGERVRSLDLSSVELEEWEDVVDPAGHDVDHYVSRAHEIWELSGQLVSRL
jgi:protein-tyrosine-phosphatase